MDMPGPGGGSRGGGGGFSGGGRGGSFGGGGFSGGNRGGGFGGGPRPGGFGGPHHHHHHHHGPHFGWGWGHRHYHIGGGGCLGPVAGAIFVVIFLVFMLIYMLMPAGDGNANFGNEYNEAAFQEAADRKYAEYFEYDSTYEDNILLYFLVEEECDQLYFIAWVGDNVNYDINELFGGNGSPLGNSVYNNVPQYYAYSLDSNLAAIMNDMEEKIVAMDLDSSFKKNTTPASPSESKLVDLTYAGAPDLTAQTVNDALASFTEATGIRTVICVDYIDNVFGSSGGNGGATALLVIAIGVLVAAIAFTSYSNNKNRKKREDK